MGKRIKIVRCPICNEVMEPYEFPNGSVQYQHVVPDPEKGSPHSAQVTIKKK